MKKKSENSFVLSAADRFSLPPESFSSPRLTLTEGRLYIEGHEGIEEYGEGLITVRCKSKCILVHGRRLNIGAMNRDELLITGGIQSVELTDRGRRK